MTIEAMSLKKGDVLEAVADCPSFEMDVRNWCGRSKHTLLWVKPEGTCKRVQVSIS
jgi:TusA-related sulfurtransferase